MPSNQTVEREMTGAETHRYKFDLKANEFFQVRVEQKGIDVILRLLDSDSKVLATMDSPNSKEGLEILSFIPVIDGNYFLEISKFDKEAEKGKYKIQYKISQNSTSANHRRVQVEQIFVEAMKARYDDEQDDVAIQKFQNALEGWKELGDNYYELLTSQAIKQIRIDFAKDIYDEAISLREQETIQSYLQAREKSLLASELFRKEGDKRYQAKTLAEAGYISILISEYYKAINYYKQSLPLRRAVGDKSGEAFSLHGIANVYRMIGKNDSNSRFRNHA